MERISAHISYQEGCVSATGQRLGIKNIPPDRILAKMKITAEKVFEPVRVHFGVPITVLSFYRCPKLNKAVGGSATSQHMLGEAIDIRATGKVTNADLFYYILNNLEFDQLIWEFGTHEEPSWVHVSYSNRNRKEVLRAVRAKGITQYRPFKQSI